MESICTRDEGNIYQSPLRSYHINGSTNRMLEPWYSHCFQKRAKMWCFRYWNPKKVSSKKAKQMKDYGEIRKQLKKTWNYRDLRVV